MRFTTTHFTIALTCACVSPWSYSQDIAPEQHDADRSSIEDGNSLKGYKFGRPITRYGDRLSLGNGRIYTYQTTLRGKPVALGVEFPKSTLSNLPTEPNDGLNCWDTNGDDNIDLHDECSGGHQRALFFDSNLTPFKYITVDWEPHGHVPAGVYDRPHFDLHFYMMDYVARNRIAVGPCFGTINCADQARGVTPVAPTYIHPDFLNTQLVFSRMGNHWVDSTAPELNGGEFTHTFILGSYEGHITFFEPMVSLEYLLSKPSQCSPIKQPTLYETAGYYPTRYCIRFYTGRETYAVSLENFEYKNATPY